ncbi:MAG: pirin family protein [Deltaproteobacteria bacterium]|nr:pirin family protein [Deltaproteobacteria bacterium]MBI3386935.1 pirin family protein [Deltaproteobacteria bacterium]
MITIRPAAARGHFDFGWLDTQHTFSFGEYHDPQHMSFRVLRVINEDRVQPGRGFGTHPHQDMEIVTYVLAGALEHRDSLGNGSIIRPGDVQRMSAGTGVTHSEYNSSQSEPVHLLQIWITPERRGLAPSYEQTHFADTRNALQLLASHDGRDGSVTVHQDVAILAARLDVRQAVTYSVALKRHAWVQVARGTATLNDHRLAAGDGAAASDERSLRVGATQDAEVLLFDLP